MTRSNGLFALLIQDAALDPQPFYQAALELPAASIAGMSLDPAGVGVFTSNPTAAMACWPAWLALRTTPSDSCGRP